MFIVKKFHSQANQFRIFFFLCLITLTLSYFFISILKNRTNIGFPLISNIINDSLTNLVGINVQLDTKESTTTLSSTNIQTNITESTVTPTNVSIQMNITESNTTLANVSIQYIVDECTDEQRQRHGNLFSQYPPDWSGCYEDFYLAAFDNLSIPVEVLMDVGANKAYAVATWLAFFLPELGINQDRLGSYMRTRPELSDSCGSCNDCRDAPMNRTNIHKKFQLKIYAFEPQPGTVHVLHGLKDWMNISAVNDLSFHIHGMAVSDHTGQVLFRLCNPGNEVCSLDVSQAARNSQIYINSTSLDDFVIQNQLSKIDILKIDTEGYEPLVFRGAKTLLKEQRIRLFIFEHLTEGAWKNTSLQVEISNLSNFGYICYIIGKSGLIRVSFCWNDKFFVRHNNLLCVSSKDRELWKNIEQLRLPGTFPSTYHNISIS